MSSRTAAGLGDMIIVAGHLIVDADDRDAYVAHCAAVVVAAREAAGCLDFAITADSVEQDRVDVYERWRSPDELKAFRGSGPDTKTRGRIRSASVDEYEL